MGIVLTPGGFGRITIGKNRGDTIIHRAGGMSSHGGGATAQQIFRRILPILFISLLPHPQIVRFTLHM